MEEKLSLAQKIEAALIKWRPVLIVLGISIIVGLVILIVLQTTLANFIATQSDYLEEMEEISNDFDIETNGQEKLLDFQDILNRAEADIAGSYAHGRIALSYAEAVYRVEESEESIQLFFDAAAVSEDHYIAPIAYFRGVLVAEELGQEEVALEKVLAFESIPGALEFYDLPRVLMTQGRLLESAGRSDEAIEIYQRVIADYPSSDWTKVAQNRIILEK